MLSKPIAVPKPEKCRVEVQRDKRLDDKDDETKARKAVRARDGSRCAIPGCREKGVHLHHIVYRSKSRKLRWQPENLVYLCKWHHGLEHGHKIQISGTAEDLIVTGDVSLLKFKL